jgi:hypothetical protein
MMVEVRWDRLEAYEFLAPIGDLYIGSMVDTHLSLVAMIRTAYAIISTMPRQLIDIACTFVRRSWAGQQSSARRRVYAQQESYSHSQTPGEMGRQQ